MTTATFSAAPTNASDAEFRAWGGGLSTALAAVGMVKTSDTGQINWATVTRPTVVTTYQGFEVWRFADTLQATQPLFVKIEYGSGASSASRPGLRFTVGKGSDGAGAITGPFGATFTSQSSSFSATATPSYVSTGGGSLLTFVLWTAAGGNIHLPFFVDRSRDPAGVPTGWAVAFSAPSTGAVSTYVYTSATVFQNAAQATPIPSGAASTTVGGVAPMYPILCVDGQGHYWQPRAILQHNANDAALAVPVSVDGRGTYLPAWPSYGGQTGTNVAIAWS